MTKYISLELLMDKAEEVYYWNGYEDTYDEVVFCKDIENIPIAEVEEVKHGKWIPYHIKHETWNEFGYKCSLCDSEIDESWFNHMISTKCCPYCDAKMHI